ncbi:hypothetical protein [Proteus columbae]|uniref:hypothetical protein n=1 Tax=Proteus columbae TaxID=1987580 RepID=UPI000C1E7222|nr:hypothetical protein [Proteus columbae]
MFNTQALYAWIALMAFSLGWIAQGWHRDNMTLEQRMLITAIEDQVSMDACPDLQLFFSFFGDKSLEHAYSLRFSPSYQEMVKLSLDNQCANADFITVFNNTQCEVGGDLID